MKNHRDAGFVRFDGLPGQVRTGCQKTPKFKSRYCHLHEPRICSFSELPEDSKVNQQDQREEKKEGVVEMILDKKVTRNTTYYKVY